MRSITLRPGESITIGDTVIKAEHPGPGLESGGERVERASRHQGRISPDEPGPELLALNDVTSHLHGPAALLAFLNCRSVERQEAFAAACDTTVGYLRHVAHGRRQCSASLAIAIDRESDGTVLFEDLCPDADWVYVRSRNSDRPGKAEASISNRTFPALDDLRPVLNEILRTGVKQVEVARYLGIKPSSVSEALNADRPWMPTYANGVRLMQLHREVCGGEGDDA